MAADKWKPEKGERYWAYGSEKDDEVGPLTWGVNPAHDEQLFAEGNVFKTKSEAEAGKTRKFG